MKDWSRRVHLIIIQIVLLQFISAPLVHAQGISLGGFTLDEIQNQLSPEQKEKLFQQGLNNFNNLSPSKQQELIDQGLNRQDQLSPAQRQQFIDKAIANKDSLNDSQKSQIVNLGIKNKDSLSKAQKEQVISLANESKSSLTPSQQTQVDQLINEVNPPKPTPTVAPTPIATPLPTIAPTPPKPEPTVTPAVLPKPTATPESTPINQPESPSQEASEPVEAEQKPTPVPPQKPVGKAPPTSINPPTQSKPDTPTVNVRDIINNGAGNETQNPSPTQVPAPSAPVENRPQEITNSGPAIPTVAQTPRPINPCKQTPQAIRCESSSDRIWNCEYNICVTQEQFKTGADKALSCVFLFGEDKENCNKELESDIAKIMATGGELCLEDSSSDIQAASCRQKGKIWNCEFKECLSEQVIDHVKGDVFNCQSLEGNKKTACLDDTKDKAILFEAAGGSCNQSTPESLACQNQGKVYNCEAHLCYTKEENEKFSKDILTCKKSDNSEACLNNIENDIAIQLAAGGEQCLSIKTQSATQCREKGKIWSCEYSECLSQEVIAHVKDDYLECQKETTPEKKEACSQAIEQKATLFEAAGGSCKIEQAGEFQNSAKACSEQGKIWNCNANECYTSEDNAIFAAEVTKCKTGPEELEQECMEDLEVKLIDMKSYSCQAGNPEALACSEKGRVYNCNAKTCFKSKLDSDKVNSAIKNCYTKSSEKEKNECLGELEEFAAVASQADGEKPDFEVPSATGFHAMIGFIGGLASAALGGACLMGYIIPLISLTLIVSESNTNKMADSRLKQLKTEYQDLKDIEGKEGVSIELQSKSFEFYIRALTVAAEIARMKGDALSQARNMYTAAAALLTTLGVIGSASTPPIPNLITCFRPAGVAAIAAAMTDSWGSKAYEDGKKYDERRLKIEKIYEKFKKHFGNGNNLLAQTRGLKGARNTNSAIINKQALPQGQTVLGLSDTAFAQRVEQFKSCGSGVSLDSTCSCKQTNSCASAQIDTSSLSAGAQSFLGRLGVETQISQGNSIINGDINASQIGRSAIAAQGKKLKRGLAGIKKKLDNSRIKRGLKPIDFSNDAGTRSFLNEVVKSDAYTKSLNDSYQNTPNSFNPEEFSPKNEEAKDLIKKVPPVIVVSPKRPSSIAALSGQDDFNLSDIELEDDQNSITLNSDTHQKEELRKIEVAKGNKSKQISKYTNSSIFNLISGRYHILQKQKRFGGRIKKVRSIKGL